MSSDKLTKKDFATISDQDFPIAPNLLLQALGCTNSDFLSSAYAYGIITFELKNRFRAAVSQLSSGKAPIPHLNIWFSLTMHSWLNAIYEDVWKLRNRAVFDKVS
jgi:hypothetical protein